MALNEDTAEWKRSDYVVRDYPLEDKFRDDGYMDFFQTERTSGK